MTATSISKSSEQLMVTKEGKDGPHATSGKTYMKVPTCYNCGKLGHTYHKCEGNTKRNTKKISKTSSNKCKEEEKG